MSGTRSQLAKGIYFYEMKRVYRWDESYVDVDEVFFAPNDCDKKSTFRHRGNLSIPPNTIYFRGNRQIEPDAPIYIEGVEWMRFDESCFGSNNNKPLEGEALERAEQKYLKGEVGNDKDKLMAIPGFHFMSEEGKRKYAKVIGAELTEEDLNPQNKLLVGVVAIAVGTFSDKYDVQKLVEENGGKCYFDVPKSKKLTHLILGGSGVTKYGQKTGKGSKKYREARKTGAREIELQFLKDIVSNKKDWKVEHQEWQDAIDKEKEEKKKANQARKEEDKKKRQQEKKQATEEANKRREHDLKRIREEERQQSGGPRRSRRRRS